MRKTSDRALARYYEKSPDTISRWRREQPKLYEAVKEYYENQQKSPQ
jgi:hypothetical protein